MGHLGCLASHWSVPVFKTLHNTYFLTYYLVANLVSNKRALQEDGYKNLVDWRMCLHVCMMKDDSRNVINNNVSSFISSNICWITQYTKGWPISADKCNV